MRQKYAAIRFRSASLEVIAAANDIIAAYEAQGYTMTVRALYYRLVARNVIENNLKSYKRFARLCNDARLAGLMDWDVIEDITRSFKGVRTWRSPRAVLNQAAQGYNEDLWRNQTHRVFLIVEKDAMLSFLNRTCSRWQIPIMAARGYPSSSVLREFALSDMMATKHQGKHLHVLHMGDHDPSGCDMSRDLKDRLGMFFNYGTIDFQRIALNIDQVEELQLPENPTKSWDARFAGYADKYGDRCWELDALPPEYANTTIEETVKEFIDMDIWEYDSMWVDHNRDVLQDFADTFKE